MRAFILFFIVLPSSVFSNPIQKCLSVFTKSMEYKLLSSAEFKSDYSKELFSGLYKQIEHSSSLTKKEKQRFILETEKTIRFIESHSNNRRLKVLSPQLLSALSAFPEIFEFTEKGLSPSSYLDTKTAFKVSLASLTYYIRAYLSHESQNLDWGRLNTILSSIAQFKEEPNSVSIYKILRAVREKHSLNEYINCR